MSLRSPSRIAIVLVNFNGAADTIACLESLRTLEAPEGGLVAIAVENASVDDSPMRLREWLEKGQHSCAHPDGEATAEFEGCCGFLQVILVQSSSNHGFAAGCNIGLARAMRDESITHFWLLNNDTTVAPRAALELLETSQLSSDNNISGSTLLYYDSPNIVQAAAGARYLRLIGRSRHYLKMKKLSEIGDGLPPPFDYIVGASMFFSRAVLDTVGFLPERYFLYVEENDWCTRARSLGVSLDWARKSHVFHKEGRSTGAEGRFKRLSDDAFYYVSRNNLLYGWDHARAFTASVIAYTILVAACYGIKGDFGKLRITPRVLRDFWRLRNGKQPPAFNSASIVSDG
jgi:GT2 family glycosyltransferase